jgi:hypothetical protein
MQFALLILLLPSTNYVEACCIFVVLLNRSVVSLWFILEDKFWWFVFVKHVRCNPLFFPLPRQYLLPFMWIYGDP